MRIAIAALVGVRIDKEAGDGVHAKRFEERLGAAKRTERAPPCGARLLVQRFQDLILLLGSGGGKFLDGREQFADSEL